MHKPFPFASLAHPAGAHLPPLELDISAQYQFCVNAGAAAARSFLAHGSGFFLHDHIARALHSFDVSVSTGLAAAGGYDALAMQEYNDAFAAGYLGRVQQELTLLRGDAAKREDFAQADGAAMKNHTTN